MINYMLVILIEMIKLDPKKTFRRIKLKKTAPHLNFLRFILKNNHDISSSAN